ncbi:hypothetical protein A6A04_16745 [Paramagnetospirillum marisnigri]|uniref:Glycosyltransferase RgtA/B/C/D-like domain-containing protein n=1 Tax=Paramagnetospirillum marisnigri TaxID=1285242 RepID=A0A178MS68_9PROT|nr:hypothetical protein [Paramagnetospirillum marisnigri]OAN51079.1 hypothetical protein A6A04_16745 [Paramagnetospirillum marisnigri]
MSRAPLTGWKLAWHALTFVLVVALLMAPALWNGYPLVYYDSEDYVEMAFTFEPIIWRIMTYGVFCTIGRVFGTLWAIPLVHAILVTWILHEAVMGFIGRWRHMVFLGVGLAVALFTGLPWVASQILADVFAGTAVLGVAVLAFGEGLQPWRRFAVAVITAVSICLHMSHVAVAAGLLIVMILIWVLSRVLRRMPRPRMLAACLSLIGGILLVPATHYALIGRAVFSESGQVLQLALFVQNGIAKMYLDEVCPAGADLEMCEHKDELPRTADEFLWGDSPFDEMGGWKAMHDESGRIVAGAIRRFPQEVATAAAINFVEQLDAIESGEDLVPMTWHFVKTMLRRYPDEFKEFRYARQQRRPPINFKPINDFQVPINQAAQLVTLGLLALAWKRRDRTTTGLALVVIMALVGNAIVCGALSNPHDRYQNRMVWLALFTAVVGAVRLDQRFAGQRRVTIVAENKALAEEAAATQSQGSAGGAS